MILHAIRIDCDGCNAVGAELGTGATAREIRALVRSEGWLRKGGLDLCSPCATKTVHTGDCESHTGKYCDCVTGNALTQA